MTKSCPQGVSTAYVQLQDAALASLGEPVWHLQHLLQPRGKGSGDSVDPQESSPPARGESGGGVERETHTPGGGREGDTHGGG